VRAAGDGGGQLPQQVVHAYLGQRGWAQFQQQRAHFGQRAAGKAAQFFQAAFGAQLEEFARQHLNGRKEKSVKLIHGTIGFKKWPDKLVVDDEEKAQFGPKRNVHRLLSVASCSHLPRKGCSSSARIRRCYVV